MIIKNTFKFQRYFKLSVYMYSKDFWTCVVKAYGGSILKLRKRYWWEKLSWDDISQNWTYLYYVTTNRMPLYSPLKTWTKRCKNCISLLLAWIILQYRNGHIFWWMLESGFKINFKYLFGSLMIIFVFSHFWYMMVRR